MVGSQGSAPTGRFTYTTYRLPTGTLTVYSISTKAHTSWLRNSFSWHAVADICCLRQQNVIFHYFHNLPLSQKLDPRLFTALFGKLSFLKLSRDLSCHIFHICPLVISFSLLWSLYRLIMFDVLLSYFQCSSLYISIMSPRILL